MAKKSELIVETKFWENVHSDSRKIARTLS